jgi:hypothetical protein
MKNIAKLAAIIIFCFLIFCGCGCGKQIDEKSIPDTATTQVSETTAEVTLKRPEYKNLGTIKKIEVVTSNTINTQSKVTAATTNSKLNNTNSKAVTTKKSLTNLNTVSKNINKTTTTVTTKAPVKAATTVTTTRPAAQQVYSNINYIPTEQEWNMFCTVVSSETGYCEEYIQKHMAHTVINRVKHMLANKNSPFPKTLYGILTQQGQYTCISNYFNGTYRSGLYPGSTGWNNTMRIIKEAWNEPDPINGGIGYYNPNMGGLNYWFENNLQFCYQDSVARYFRLK